MSFTCLIRQNHRGCQTLRRYPRMQGGLGTPQTCMIELQLEKHVDPQSLSTLRSLTCTKTTEIRKSRDINQLIRAVRTKLYVQSNCFPVVSINDLSFYTNLYLEPHDMASPCGLIPQSIFNDTFILLPPQDSPKESIDIKFDQLAWDIDVQEKFKQR